LLTITRNAAIDNVRSRRARPEAPAESVGELLPADHADLGDRVAQDAEARRTFAALATLPEPQRRAVVLATYAGLTAVEVGVAEGVPLGTAKTRIRTGMARLRLLLAEEVTS
jgi:RNA polymerase sigma-70 factor (ECF subfamily)